MTKIKRFVLDTNTLISTFLLSPTTGTAQAYYQAKAKGKIIMSEETFQEFAGVFIRPKFDRYLELAKRLTIIEDLNYVVEVIKVKSVVTVCRDPKDNKFLELAIDAGADCIITGDQDLLVLNPFNNILILSAADFIKAF